MSYFYFLVAKKNTENVSNETIEQDSGYGVTQKEIEGRMEAWLGGGATKGEDYKDFQHKLKQQSFLLTWQR